MSEIMGIGVVMKSISGWMGSVMFLISFTIGPITSLKKDPTSRLTPVNSTFLSPSMMAFKISSGGTKTLASGLAVLKDPIPQSNRKFDTMRGNPAAAFSLKPRSEAFNSSASLSSATASDATPMLKSICPNSDIPSLASPGSLPLKISMAAASPKRVENESPSTSSSMAESCKNASFPVNEAGRVAMTLTKSSLASLTSM